MSPLTIGILVLAGLCYAVLTVLHERERAAAARQVERRRQLASQADFTRRLAELRARADAEEDEDAFESWSEGGEPAPPPIGLQLLRPDVHVPRRSQA